MFLPHCPHLFFSRGPPFLGCSHYKKKLSAVLVQVKDLSGLLPIGEPLGTDKDTDSFSARPCQMTGVALNCIAQTEAGCSTVFFILSEIKGVHGNTSPVDNLREFSVAPRGDK